MPQPSPEAASLIPSIALLTGEYPPAPGGVGDYTAQLAAALRQRGHTVSVLTIQGGRLLAYGAPGEAPRDVGHAEGLDWSQRSWPAIVAALDELQPTWLHIQYQTGAFAMSPGLNVLPWRLRGLPGRPLIAVTFHDVLAPYLFPKAGPLRQWANRRLAADADALVATNDADAARLEQLLGPFQRLQLPVRAPSPSRSKPFVIPIGSNIPVDPPPGYTPAAWRAALGASPDALLVAYFGLLSATKGLDLLVDALAALARPWRLLLIGGSAAAPQDVAHARAVHERIATLGLARHVIATGHVSPAEVSANLLAADIVALPYRDGASFRRGSLLAALAHGRPVITTAPASGADEAPLSSATRLVPADTAALAQALVQLADDPAERARLGAAGQALAARFSWASIAQQHEQLYAICSTSRRKL